MQEYRKQKSDLSLQLGKIQELGPESRCPTCNKKIGEDLPGILEHFKKEIAKASGRLKTASATVDALSKQREKTEKLLEDAKSEERNLNSQVKRRAKEEEKKTGLDKQIQSEIQRLQEVSAKIKGMGSVIYNEKAHEEIKGRFKELDRLEKRRLVLAEKVSRIHAVKETIRKLSSSLAAIAKATERISNSISQLGFNQDEYGEAKQEHEDASKSYHEKREDLINAKNALAATSKDIKETIRKIAEEENKKRQIESEQKKIDALNALDRLFAEFRLDLISRIRPLLSVRASELFRRLTDGKYPNISLDEDYDMMIEDDGKRFPLERFSGGEEDLASLCLRIAISQVIEERSGSAGIDFIVLDEIFGSQDENRKSNILKALNELSSQFRQIIVITHVEDVKDVIPYVFNVIETADRSSRVVAEGSPGLALSA